MNVGQGVAFLLAAGLTALAVAAVRTPVRTLRSLPLRDNLSAEDRRYFQGQAWRRLAGAALFLVLAGLIAGAQLTGLDAAAVELGQSLDAQRERTGQAVLTPEQRELRRFYAAYWIGVLLLVLVLVVLAGVELAAIRRYQRRHVRILHEDREAALARFAEQRRRERRGPSGD